jgi:hypothetical protein
MLLIPAMFLLVVALALLCLAIAGAVLSVVLRVMAAVLWVAVKMLEHRSAVPLITIVIEDDELPVMRDVTPMVPKLDRW